MKGGNNIDKEDKDFRKSFELYDEKGLGFKSKDKTSRYWDLIINTYTYVFYNVLISTTTRCGFILDAGWAPTTPEMVEAML